MNSLRYAIITKAITDQVVTPAYESPLLSPIEIDKALRKVSMTEWFVNPVQGQPRYVDIYRLRTYGRSEWVSVIISYLQNRIAPIPIEVIPRDPKKRKEPSTRIQDEIRQAERLLEECTPDGKSYKMGIESALIRDLLELDAGVIVKQFTEDSYMGNPTLKGSLRAKGKRKLVELVAADGGSFLKDVGAHYTLNGYYQYSYTRPLSAPIFFDTPEICYIMRYPRTYSPYGWAPTQNADSVINSLINSAVWNNNFFAGEGIPKGMITIDGDDSAVRRFRSYWRQQIKGRWFSIPVFNKEAKWVPFGLTAQDMQWLSGQKWYQRLIAGLYQVHPSEVGLEDTSRQGQSAIDKKDTKQKRSSVVPILLLLSQTITADVMSEISPRIMFRYKPEDMDELQELSNLETQLIESGMMTINELREKRDLKPLPWGNIPQPILQNLIRSYSKLGVMPTIQQMNRLQFDKVEIPKPQAPQPFDRTANEVMEKTVLLQETKTQLLQKIIRELDK